MMRIAFMSLLAATLAFSLGPRRALAQDLEVQTRTQSGDSDQARQQDQGRATRQQDRQQNRSGRQASKADEKLATCVAIHNQKEVELSQFAEQRAQSPEVKQFARQMIEDHQQLAQQLQKWTGGEVSLQSGGQQVDRDSGSRQNRSGNTATRSRAGDQANGSADGVRVLEAEGQGAGANRTMTQEPDMAEISREIASKNLQSAKQALQEKPDQKFDEAYMGMQIAGHMVMLDSLQVFERHVSPELAQQLQQAQQTVQQHLEQAKKIMQQLENEPGRNQPGEASRQG